MRYVYYFIISLAIISCLSFIEAPKQPQPSESITFHSPTSKQVQRFEKPLTKLQLDSIIQVLSPTLHIKDLPQETTPADIVRWLLNLLGGFITTLIMYFLHKWFPKIFPTAKLRDYIDPPSGNNAKNQ